MSCWPSGTSTPSILAPDISHERQDVSQHIKQQNANNRRVGLESGKSSVVKQRKLRSKIWEAFEKYKEVNGKDWARCKICQKDFDGSSKLGTTHLRNHFISCQRKRNRDGGGDEPANLAGNLSNPIAIKEKSVMDQLDAARMIIKQGDASLINSTNVGYIIDVYREEKEKLRNYFVKLSKVSRCLCLTVYGDCIGETCLMVWFIDDDWKLKNKIIGFKTLKDEKTVVGYIKNVLLEWGIENNLSSMVTDGDGDNDFMDYSSLRNDLFSTQGSLPFKNKLHKEAFFSYCDESNDNEDFLRIVISFPVNARLGRLFGNIRDTSSTNENFQNAIDAAIKSLGKEVTLQAIPSLGEWWDKFAQSEVSDFWGVLKDVLGLKETFFDLENSYPHFQNLTKEEWDRLGAIYEWFEDWGDFPLQYCSNYNTANTYFPLLCWIYKCSKELRKYHFEDLFIKDLIERSDNYWCDYNLVLAVASVLDPRFRMDTVKNWYKQIFGNEWETQVTKFMDCFASIYNEYNNLKECTSGLEEINSSISYEMLHPLGKLCKSAQELDHVQWPNPELCLYLEEVKFPSIKDFDILEWWRIHARYFPTLARMARDVLSIQISGHRVTLSDDEIGSLSKFDIEEVYTCTRSWLCEEL